MNMNQEDLLLRFFILFLTVSLTSPVLAHPNHLETAGGHSHWFELALGTLILAGLAIWIAVRRTGKVAPDHDK